jgi:cytochrome c553
MTSRSALLALGLAIAAPVFTAPAQGADAKRGADLGYTCQGCHGIENYKNPFPIYNVPKLGGQHAAYLVAALKAYASQERGHPTMHAHAATMSATDMADVATYLAGQELTPTGRAVGTAPKASHTCVACHGNDGIGILPEYPNLNGQHEDYLVQALKAYGSGQRKNAVMAGMTAALTNEDIEALARYYAAQEPALCSTKDIGDTGQCKD